MRRRLMLPLLPILGLMVAGHTVVAQLPGADDAAITLRRSFAEVSRNVSKSAELVPADTYDYRPAPSVRTFGQMIGHIADGNNYYCARASGRKVEWADPAEKGSTDKATLMQKLEESIDACGSAYGGKGHVGPMVDNLAHTNLHYGNIITYLRMLGMVPPSS